MLAGLANGLAHKNVGTVAHPGVGANISTPIGVRKGSRLRSLIELKSDVLRLLAVVAVQRKS
jgi:hypothetical protein